MVAPLNIIILLLVSFIVLKLAFQITLVRGFYLLLIIWTPSTNQRLMYQGYSPVPVIIYVLIILNLIIDIISRIQFCFFTSNPHSETVNVCKILHYLTLGLSAFLFAQEQSLKERGVELWICYSISLCLFICLIGLKSQSSNKNFLIKGFMMRFYSLCICAYIRNIIRLFLEEKHYQIIDYILIFVLSQGIYTAISYKLKRV